MVIIYTIFVIPLHHFLVFYLQKIQCICTVMYKET